MRTELATRTHQRYLSLRGPSIEISSLEACAWNSIEIFFVVEDGWIYRRNASGSSSSFGFLQWSCRE
jgi:hypothetical protein